MADIQFETYIFDFTGAGATVAQALMRAAARGVRTHLVVDGVGTGALPKAWAEQLQAAGVLCSVYSPLGPLGLLLPHRWRRLHRKLCVVDGRVLFCGGINVLDDFHDPNHGTLEAPRFDFAVRATGSLVASASDTMDQLWWRMQAVRDARQRRLPEALRALRAASAARHAEQGGDPHAGPRARHPGAARQRAQPQPHREGIPQGHRHGAARGHHRQCLLHARWQAAPRAGDGRAPGRARAPAAAGAVRILHAVPRSPPGVWRAAGGRGRDLRVRPELSARQGGRHRRAGRPALGHGGFVQP